MEPPKTPEMHKIQQKTLVEFFKDNNNVTLGAKYLTEQMIDDAVWEIVFEQHYLHKIGAIKAIDGDLQNIEDIQLIKQPNLDIFGKEIKKPVDIVISCPICNNTAGYSRFAPHLAKCMGMGRNSSRIASKRICQARSDEKPNYYDEDDEKDYNWQTTEKRKKKQSSRGTSKRNGKAT